MEMHYCSRCYHNCQSVLIFTISPPHTHTHTGTEHSAQPARIQCAHPPVSVGGGPGSAHCVARIHTPCVGSIYHHWICCCVSFCFLGMLSLVLVHRGITMVTLLYCLSRQQTHKTFPYNPYICTIHVNMAMVGVLD